LNATSFAWQDGKQEKIKLRR